MNSFISWLFLVIGVIAMACGFLYADAVTFGIGSLFAVLGGADIAERLSGEQGDESY